MPLEITHADCRAPLGRASYHKLSTSPGPMFIPLRNRAMSSFVLVHSTCTRCNGCLCRISDLKVHGLYCSPMGVSDKAIMQRPYFNLIAVVVQVQTALVSVVWSYRPALILWVDSCSINSLKFLSIFQ